MKATSRRWRFWGNWPDEARTYFEVVLPGAADALVEDLRALPIVRSGGAGKDATGDLRQTYHHYGRRRASGQVAIGAVSEADRHNIRGEHISVDTIPLVGEQTRRRVRGVAAGCPRAKALVLAGALMGGDTRPAVREVRQAGTAGHQLAHSGIVSTEMCFPANVVAIRFGDRADRHLPHLRAAAHNDDTFAVDRL